MKKVWLRLGGNVTASKEEMSRILNGDVDALISAIKANGFELNGETYIPQGCAEVVDEDAEVSGDVDFDISGVVLR